MRKLLLAVLVLVAAPARAAVDSVVTCADAGCSTTQASPCSCDTSGVFTSPQPTVTPGYLILQDAADSLNDRTVQFILTDAGPGGNACDANKVYTLTSGACQLPLAALDTTTAWPVSSDLVCTNCIGATELSDIALGTDTTGSYAAGTAEAGAATTGDSATAFFSSGQIERARGGTGADTSAYGNSLIGSNSGNTTIDVDTLAELNTALTTSLIDFNGDPDLVTGDTSDDDKLDGAAIDTCDFGHMLGFRFTDPDVNDVDSVQLVPALWTVPTDGMRCVCTGGTSATIAIQEGDANGSFSAPTTIESVVCGLTSTVGGAPTDATITSGSSVRAIVTAESGTVTECIGYVRFTGCL